MNTKNSLTKDSCKTLSMNTKILKKYFNEMYADNGAVRKIYELYSSWLKDFDLYD